LAQKSEVVSAPAQSGQLAVIWILLVLLLGSNCLLFYVVWENRLIDCSLFTNRFWPTVPKNRLREENVTPSVEHHANVNGQQQIIISPLTVPGNSNSNGSGRGTSMPENNLWAPGLNRP